MKKISIWQFLAVIVLWIVLYRQMPKPYYDYGIPPAVSTANTLLPAYSAIQSRIQEVPEDKATRRLLAKKISGSESGELADGWGNEIQIYIDENSMLHEDVRLFSYGEDGRSTSLGNDPDDLNSWNMEAQLHFYNKKNPKLMRNALKYKLPWIFNSLFRSGSLALVVLCLLHLIIRCSAINGRNGGEVD